MRDAATSDLPLLAAALRGTFPTSDNAPLALALVRLLAEGRPVALRSLARVVGRTQSTVRSQVAELPNVEFDADSICGFCGLTIHPTPHRFVVGGRKLHTWCAWDTLFLPTLLRATATVRSPCAVSGTTIELVVSPDAIISSAPDDARVSFPPLATTDPTHITSTFCCHVHFLAGGQAASSWQGAHSGGQTLDLEAAFMLGQQAVTPLLASEDRWGGAA